MIYEKRFLFCQPFWTFKSETFEKNYSNPDHGKPYARFLHERQF